MIKKISVQRLNPGIFIHKMNCGWMDHHFLTVTSKSRAM